MMAKSHGVGFFEEYICGCVSDTKKRRSDLLGYCAIHGTDPRHVYEHKIAKQARKRALAKKARKTR